MAKSSSYRASQHQSSSYRASQHQGGGGSDYSEYDDEEQQNIRSSRKEREMALNFASSVAHHQSTAAEPWRQAHLHLLQTPGLRVSGVTGHWNRASNGDYFLEDGPDDKPPTFRKMGGSEIYLYYASDGSWRMSGKRHMENRSAGKYDGFLRSAPMPRGQLPSAAPTWQAFFTGAKFESLHNVSLKLLSASAIEAAFEADEESVPDRWRVARWRMQLKPALLVSGLSGGTAVRRANGHYVLAPGSQTEPPAFKKVFDEDCWVYYAQDGAWRVGGTSAQREARENLNDAGAIASEFMQAGSLPGDEKAKWCRTDGSSRLIFFQNWERDTNITVRSLSTAQHVQEMVKILQRKPSTMVHMASYKAEASYRSAPAFQPESSYKAPDSSLKLDASFKLETSYRPEKSYRLEASYKPQSSVKPQKSLKSSRTPEPEQPTQKREASGPSFKAQQSQKSYKPEASFKSKKSHKSDKSHKSQGTRKSEKARKSEKSHRPWQTRDGGRSDGTDSRASDYDDEDRSHDSSEEDHTRSFGSTAQSDSWVTSETNRPGDQTGRASERSIRSLGRLDKQRTMGTDRDEVEDEDAENLEHKPLAQYATEFLPEKAVDEYLMDDCMEVPEMSEHVGQYINIVIKASWDKLAEKAKQGALKDFAGTGLTRDMAFAVVLFTMELGIELEEMGADYPGVQSEFYAQYNNALRDRVPETMACLAGYSHFLFAGLSRLPVYTGVLWRGINDANAVATAIRNYAPRMKTVHWSAFSSASPDREIAYEFAGDDGLIFRMEVQGSATDIRMLSSLEEDERLILPNAEFVVDRVAAKVGNVWEIHLVESPGSYRF